MLSKLRSRLWRQVLGSVSGPLDGPTFYRRPVQPQSSTARSYVPIPNEPRSPLFSPRFGLPPFFSITSWQQAVSIALVTATVAAPFVQSDWPVPRAAARTNDLGGTQGTPLPLAQRQGNNKYDWPNPIGPLPARQADSLGFPQPIRDYANGLNTANRPLPDWPVPRAAARPLDLLTTTTVPLPLASVVAVPFSKTEWPVPRAAARSTDLLSWIQSTPIQRIQPFSETEWPVPRGPAPLNVGDVKGFPEPILDYAIGLNTANRPRPDWSNPRAPQRGVDLGGPWSIPLAAVQAQGFNQYDWPVPKGRPPLNTGFVESLLPVPLATVVTVPFGETEWPNPRAPQPLNVGFVQGSLPSFLQFQGKNQYDWPVPKTAAPLNVGWVQGFPAPILNVAIGLNDGRWRNLDWPNPRGAVPNQPLGWTQNLQQAPFTSPPIPPPAQRDWPNPGLGKPPLNVGWVSGFPLPILNIAVGLNDGRWRNLDWPVPRGAQRPVDLLTWIGPKTQPAPFAQYDWPVPKGSGPRQADSVGFPEPILNYAVGLNAANKRPSDWPVPRGPQRSIDALTWTQTLALQLTAAPQKPFAQNDWPLAVPRVYRQIAETRGFELPILNYAVGLNDANKRKYDWPNPIGKPPLNVGRVQGFPEPLLQAQIPVSNLRKYDWPVPIGKPPLNVGFAQGFPEPILAGIRAFSHLRNYDWPVPKGPRAGISLRTWTLSLQQTTLIPPPSAVCAHVEILTFTSEVEVLSNTADVEALAGSTSIDVLSTDADTDVLVPEAVVSFDECPGTEVVVPPTASVDICNRVTEAGEGRITEDGEQRIVEECNALLNARVTEDDIPRATEDSEDRIIE